MGRVFGLPFTLAFLGVMVAANWLAGTFAGFLPPEALTSWGISHESVLNGEAFRLVTGTFLSHDAGMFWRQLLFAASVIGAHEWLEGSLRTALFFFAIDIVGSLLVLFMVLPLLVSLPNEIGEAALRTHDVGMSAGGFGLIGALVVRNRHRWWLLLAVVLTIAIKIAVDFEAIADSAHLLSLLIGFAASALVWPTDQSRRSARP